MTRKPTNIFKVRELQRLKIQEYMLKGYPSIKIMELINMERQRDGLPQFVRASIYRMINEVKAEHNLWYYEMLKDQTAFIILHRQKILSIELYKRMLHEKIVLAGGIADIKPLVLNRLVQSLHDLTMSQSKLEKELPMLFGMYKEKSPEELKRIELAIMDGFSVEQQAEIQTMYKTPAAAGPQADANVDLEEEEDLNVPEYEKIIDGINAFIDSKQEEQEGQENDNINESTTIPKKPSNTGISAVI